MSSQVFNQGGRKRPGNTITGAHNYRELRDDAIDIEFVDDGIELRGGRSNAMPGNDYAPMGGLN